MPMIRKTVSAVLLALATSSSSAAVPAHPAPAHPAPAHSAAPAAAAVPKLVITEIMYDPTSPESDDQQTEWVEIHNYGEVPVKLGGLMLTSGTAAEPHALRQKYVVRDLTIKPQEYLVVGIGSQSLYAPYGLPPFAAYCDEARYAWFTNSGDSVAIRDAKKNVIDEVVYSSDSPWPVSRGGASIQFLCPPGQDPQLANDDGKNWVASGASNSEEFKGHGRGTPGKPPRQPTTRVVAATQPAKTQAAAARR
jgi:hypothetical protein